MDQFVEVLKLLSPSSLPVVVLALGLFLGGFWIYRKTQNIEQARKITKVERDTDSQKVHDDILKLQFEVTSMKGVIDLHRETLTDLQKQMQIVVKELVELNCSIKLILDERRKND